MNDNQMIKTKKKDGLLSLILYVQIGRAHV